MVVYVVCWMLTTAHARRGSAQPQGQLYSQRKIPHPYTIRQGREVEPLKLWGECFPPAVLVVVRALRLSLWGRQNKQLASNPMIKRPLPSSFI